MKKELEELQPNRLFANRDTLEEAFKNGMDMCGRLTDGQSIFGITALMVVVICLLSSLSKARTKSFSSLTKKGLYCIFFPVEGNSNSYVGVAIFGKGIISYKDFSMVI